MTDRRRTHRHAGDAYDGFTDRRQPDGVVATWVRVAGGHVVRGRVDYLHLSRVLRARVVLAFAPLDDAGDVQPFGTLTLAPDPPKVPTPRGFTAFRIPSAWASCRPIPHDWSA